MAKVWGDQERQLWREMGKLGTYIQPFRICPMQGTWCSLANVA